MRSWNGVQVLPGLAVVCEDGQALPLLSTVMNCLSSSGRKLLWNPVSKTGRPGKLNEAPKFCVDRKTKNPLARSGSVVVTGPRLNTWQERYALPLLSQATDVSPLACQYSRGVLRYAAPPRVKLFGTDESFQLRPLSRL